MTPNSAYGPRRRKVADTFNETPAPEPEKKVNSSIWISVKVHKALRIKAAELGQGYTMSSLMEEGAQMVLAKYANNDEE